MPISISDHLGIDESRFAQSGALNAILDVDSKLFIDPHFLKVTQASELQGSYERLNQHFAGILKLLMLTKHRGDHYWRAAAERLTFPELKGLCIGYASSGTSGSGMGPKLRSNLLGTAKAIVDAGTKDPEIFELMGLFEPGIGPDRISDMVAQVILVDLLNYSQRVFTELGAPTRTVRYKNHAYELAWNPFNRSAIILVPMDVLRDLPTAFDWDSIDTIVTENVQLRLALNSMVADTWRRVSNLKKEIVRDLVLSYPELLDKLIEAYRTSPTEVYDFEYDPAGQISWYSISKAYAGTHPLSLTLAQYPTVQDILDVVLTMRNQFKCLVEDNGLNRLLYDRDQHPKHEEAAQLIFFGIADSYCKSNELDLSREPNAGRGPVDFKVSRGYTNRVLVETKLTTNKRLMHGFEKQIVEYQRAERSTCCVYVVIDVDGGSVTRPNQLRAAAHDARMSGMRVPELVFVDARFRPSASKAA